MTGTGDMGYFDEAGRLFIVGREDDMIVSGGENVYPRAVENALGEHPDLADNAVIGVSDEDFGQRLAASSFPARAPTSTKPHAGVLEGQGVPLRTTTRHHPRRRDPP